MTTPLITPMLHLNFPFNDPSNINLYLSQLNYLLYLFSILKFLIIQIPRLKIRKKL
jgi:hypothetical protein